MIPWASSLSSALSVSKNSWSAPRVALSSMISTGRGAPVGLFVAAPPDGPGVPREGPAAAPGGARAPVVPPVVATERLGADAPTGAFSAPAAIQAAIAAL